MADGRENILGRIAFGPATSASELRRFAVTAPVDAAHAIARLRDRVKELEEALIRCAEIAGEDGEGVEAARSGAMTFPSVEEYAIQAVTQLRKDYGDA